jgi:molybdopterin converting factor small subunit
MINMEIHVRLYGVLREKLAPESHGQIVVDLPEGTTIADILTRFEVAGHVHVSVNEDMEADRQAPLHDGDQVDILPPSAGG